MAYASSIRCGNWEQLKKDLLTCPVCQDFFDNTNKKARTLTSCLHSFCEECLTVLVAGRTSGTFQCPMCQNETTIHDDGVLGFPVDFHKQNLLDYLPTDSDNRATTNWHSQHTCTACKSHAKAVSWCNDCHGGFLCRVCSEQHQKLFVFSDHTVEELTEEMERSLEERSHEKMCSAHEQEISKVCITCNLEPVCDTCIETSHKEDHRISSLAEVADQSRLVLRNLTDSVLSKQEPLRLVRCNVNREHEMVQKQGDASSEALHQVFEECGKELKLQEAVIKSNITDSRSHVQKKLIEKKEEAELKLMQMGSCYEHVDQAMHRGSDIKIVRTRKHVEATMKDISSWKIDTKPSNQLRVLQFDHQKAESLLSKIKEVVSEASVGSLVDEVVTIKHVDQAFKGHPCGVQVQVSDSFGTPLQNIPTSVLFEVYDPKDKVIKYHASLVSEGNVKIVFKVGVNHGIFHVYHFLNFLIFKCTWVCSSSSSKNTNIFLNLSINSINLKMSIYLSISKMCSSLFSRGNQGARIANAKRTTQLGRSTISKFISKERA